MLVNKGGATGPLHPDTFPGVDPRVRGVRLDSIQARVYDGLIIASRRRPAAWTSPPSAASRRSPRVASRPCARCRTPPESATCSARRIQRG